MDRKDKSNGNNGNSDEARSKRERTSPPQQQQQQMNAATAGINAPQLQPIALTRAMPGPSIPQGPPHTISGGHSSGQHHHHHHKSSHHHGHGHGHGHHGSKGLLLGMGKGMDDPGGSRRTSKRKRAKVGFNLIN